MSKSKKGSLFERNFCRQLSLWWTTDDRDDVFWRTAGSGGRATNRSKVGKTTCNSYGDICAIDPLGQPFLDLFTLELKRGYSKFTVADLLDRSARAAKQTYEEWIEQAQQSAKQAGSLTWAIVTQRNLRIPLMFTPSWVIKDLNFDPPISLEFTNGEFRYSGFHLKSFFESVQPKDIKSLVNQYKRKKK